MHVVLKDLIDECVVVYLDDILVYSRTEDEHKKHLRAVFSRLRDHSLHCKPSKCELFLPRVEFLGHYISANGVEVDDVKTSAVRNWP